MAENTNIDVEQLATLLFYIENAQVMLPDIAVAEIIEYRELEAIEDAPDWLLGNMAWRGLTVPVIALETLNQGDALTLQSSSKIIVLNSASDVGFRYWAFVAKETPKLQRIAHDSIVNDPDAELGEAQLMAAELYGEPIMIADLEKIEGLLKPFTP